MQRSCAAVRCHNVRCHEKNSYIWLQRLDDLATRLGTLFKLSRMSMPNVPGCDALCARQMDLPADSRACNAHAPRYAATTSTVTRKYDTSGFNDWTISPLGCQPTVGTLSKLSRMSMSNVPKCDAMCARQMDLPADSRACNAHAPRYAATTSAVTRKTHTAGFNVWTISPPGWALSSSSHACPCQMYQAVMHCALVRWTCLRIRVHATLMRRGTLPQRPLSRENTIHLASTTGQSRH